jgi:hypothetical protein
MSEPIDETCWMCRERMATADPEVISTAHDAALSATTAVPRSIPQWLCVPCRDRTRAFDAAWHALYRYLADHWKDIVQRGSFDLSQAFGPNASATALHAHLFFVKLLGAKLVADHVNVDVSSFADALRQGLPHPEITLLIADCTTQRGQLRYYQSDVSVLGRDEAVYSAVWMTLAYPVAVKVCYLQRAAPVLEPEGHPWHPTRQRKIVKLSPYKGDTRSVHARRDLRL